VTDFTGTYVGVSISLAGVRWSFVGYASRDQHRSPDTNQRYTDAKQAASEISQRLFQLTLQLLLLLYSECFLYCSQIGIGFSPENHFPSSLIYCLTVTYWRARTECRARLLHQSHSCNSGTPRCFKDVVGVTTGLGASAPVGYG